MFKNRLKDNRKLITNISIRVGIFLSVLFILIGIFITGSATYIAKLHEGDVALRDIFAPFDFSYYGEVDKEATEELRGKAAAQVKLVYDFDEKARQAPLLYVKDLFTNLESVKAEQISDEEKLIKLKKKNPELKDTSFVTLFNAADQKKVKNSIDDIINKIGSNPIIPKADRQALEKSSKEISLRDLKAKTEKTRTVDELIELENIQKALTSTLADEAFKEDSKLKLAVPELLNACVVSNIKRNEEEFAKRMKDARARIPEVLKEISVKKNEIILERGEKIRKQHIMQLEKIFGEEVSEKEKLSAPISLTVILLILLTITAISLNRYGPKVYNNNSYLLLIAMISILLLAGARVITASFLSSYFIPIAAASMLLAILLNENVAILITLMSSIGCGIIVGNKLDMMVVCLVGGVVGVYAVRNLRKRFQLLKAGVLVGCANFVMISSFGILTKLEPHVFILEGSKGFANGIISSFIVMGLLPVFEYLFKITTDITLLELSDLNHPMLKELTLKAAGTYHHSLLVGNLAESACDAIGANSLLARVGAYYHDIGKVEKAEYFGENIVEGESHHDKLSPSMSALVITNHVKDGVELARKHKLNQSIVDFIQQHHGNTLIYYFYQRALEKVTDDSQLKEEDFRYPGPKPQTKETAIVLLADAVEASSRTLSKPTPARIEGLVRKIINNKFIDGQLDECELTLKDLHKIAESFVRVLTGVFHSRVEYPDIDEKSRGKDKNKETKDNSDVK